LCRERQAVESMSLNVTRRVSSVNRCSYKTLRRSAKVAGADVAAAICQCPNRDCLLNALCFLTLLICNEPEGTSRGYEKAHSSRLHSRVIDSLRDIAQAAQRKGRGTILRGKDPYDAGIHGLRR
jgi:hypothetical protein